MSPHLRAIAWLHQHSLSMMLLFGWLVCVVWSLFYAPGTRLYDFWLSLEGGFSGGAIMAIYARQFFERGSDPTRRTRT